MKNKTMRVISVLLSVLMIAGAFSAMTFTSSAASAGVSATSDYTATDTVERGLILHCWSWSFNNIKSNLKKIADAGYAAVQTSPINAVYEGEDGGMELYGNGKWYFQYQPTGFSIGNYQLGTEDEFKSMCKEAHKYGVKVIVDVVANHTTPTKSAVSDELKNIEGGLYHTYSSNTVSRRRVTQMYDGLPDINTQNVNYQNMVLDFLKRAVSDGADGFRYDTAKHIELPDDEDDEGFFGSDFWPTVLNNGSVFQYGEVLQGVGSAEITATRFTDYSKIMHVTASSYGNKIREYLKKGTSTARALSEYGAENVTGDRLVTWVESHDTYANSGSVSSATSFWLDNDAVRRGWAVIAATGDTTNLFFARPEGSKASEDTYLYSSPRWGTNKIGNAGDENYFHPEVVAVNKFHNEMKSESFAMKNLNTLKQAIIISRGDKGAVMVNNGTTDIEVNQDVDILSGYYKDVVNGTEFVVADGKLTGTLKAGKVAVIKNTDSAYYSVTKPVEPAKTTVKLSAKTKTIYVGGTTTVTAKVANGSGKTTYKSGKASVATVSANGKVTAKKAGTVKITATNNKVSSTITITVKNPTIKINKTKIKVKKTAKITTSHTSGTVKYTSSDKKIATVSKKGVVKGVKKGNVKITVKCKNYSKTFKVKITK